MLEREEGITRPCHAEVNSEASWLLTTGGCRKPRMIEKLAPINPSLCARSRPLPPAALCALRRLGDHHPHALAAPNSPRGCARPALTSRHLAESVLEPTTVLNPSHTSETPETRPVSISNQPQGFCVVVLLKQEWVERWSIPRRPIAVGKCINNDDNSAMRRPNTVTLDPEAESWKPGGPFMGSRLLSPGERPREQARPGGIPPRFVQARAQGTRPNRA